MDMGMGIMKMIKNIVGLKECFREINSSLREKAN
jgi:hypothetical protein